MPPNTRPRSTALYHYFAQRLGAVQETLFIPLAGRARESRKAHPVLRDPKAAELVAAIDFDTATYGRGAGGMATVLRSAIFDSWVRSLERLGLRVVESATITRPPRALRRQLPARYRYLLPLAGPVLGKLVTLTLFQVPS
jgi:hypothetical protein